MKSGLEQLLLNQELERTPQRLRREDLRIKTLSCWTNREAV
jgi:hypothetical protein